MAFWTDTSNIASPKRNFRFRVQFADNGSFTTASEIGTTEMYWAKTAQKPGFSVGSVEHMYLNHAFKFPGRVTWNDVSITMVDPGGTQGVGYALALMLQNAGYSVPNTSSDLQTISKESAVGATGTVTITQLNAAGEEIETWRLYNAFITEAAFGTLDYGNEDLTEYSITLKYDWAQMMTTGGSVEYKGATS
jgi:hypothetical protein